MYYICVVLRPNSTLKALSRRARFVIDTSIQRWVEYSPDKRGNLQLIYVILLLKMRFYNFLFPETYLILSVFYTAVGASSSGFVPLDYKGWQHLWPWGAISPPVSELSAIILDSRHHNFVIIYVVQQWRTVVLRTLTWVIVFSDITVILLSDILTSNLLDWIVFLWRKVMVNELEQVQHWLDETEDENEAHSTDLRK